MTKLINCKTCNAEISSSAKQCPKCGAKIKKPIYKKIWFWIIIIIILIAAINSGNEDNSANNNSNTNNTTNNSNNVENKQENIEYITLTVDDLEQALEDNAAAAKDTYNNKYVEFTGKLSVIDSDLKYISVESSTKEFDLIGIHCTIKTNEQKEIVKSLTKDEEITIKGKVTDVGEILGYYVDIVEIVNK